MIQIYVNPARVEKVVFTFESEIEGDFDLAAWVAIQPLVKRIKRVLKATVRRSLGTSQRGDGK